MILRLLICAACFTMTANAQYAGLPATPIDPCPSGATAMTRGAHNRPIKCLPHNTGACISAALGDGTLNATAPSTTTMNGICCWHNRVDYHCCTNVEPSLCPSYNNVTVVIHKPQAHLGRSGPDVYGNSDTAPGGSYPAIKWPIVPVTTTTPQPFPSTAPVVVTPSYPSPYNAQPNPAYVETTGGYGGGGQPSNGGYGGGGQPSNIGYDNRPKPAYGGSNIQPTGYNGGPSTSYKEPSKPTGYNGGGSPPSPPKTYGGNTPASTAAPSTYRTSTPAPTAAPPSYGVNTNSRSYSSGPVPVVVPAPQPNTNYGNNNPAPTAAPSSYGGNAGPVVIQPVGNSYGNNPAPPPSNSYNNLPLTGYGASNQAPLDPYPTDGIVGGPSVAAAVNYGSNTGTIYGNNVPTGNYGAATRPDMPPGLSNYGGSQQPRPPVNEYIPRKPMPAGDYLGQPIVEPARSTYGDGAPSSNGGGSVDRSYGRQPAIRHPNRGVGGYARSKRNIVLTAVGGR